MSAVGWRRYTRFSERHVMDNAVLSFESGNASVVDSYECIESISSSVVSVLQSAASTFVPTTASSPFGGTTVSVEPVLRRTRGPTHCSVRCVYV